MESSDEDRSNTLVVHNGSDMIRAGFAGEEAPQTVIPSIVEKSIKESTMVGVRSVTRWRSAPRGRRYRSKLVYPIVDGVVESWSAVEELWRLLFYDELRICPEENRVLLTETPHNPDRCREKTAQVMFESFCFEAMFLASEPVIALVEYGRTTGVVLDSGYSCTYAAPVYEGYGLTGTSQRVRIGGKYVTDGLVKLLSEQNGISFTTTPERWIARDIKEHCCYVASDYKLEIKKGTVDAKTYELPDGQLIKIHASQYQTPEILFNPTAIEDGPTFSCKACQQYTLMRKSQKQR